MSVHEEEREIEQLIAQLEVGGDFHPLRVSVPRMSVDTFYARRRKRQRAERDWHNYVKSHLDYARKWKSIKDRRSVVGKAEGDMYDASFMGPIDNRQGIQLNSREITSIAERPMYTGDHLLSDSTIRETSWDLSRIVERPTLVTAFQWTAERAGLLYSAPIPSGILPIRLAKIPFQSFQYWRGDVTLRLQVAGSPIVQGIIAMTFVPLVSRMELDSMSWDLSSLSINPTVYLYANTNTHAELRIPYNHFCSYLRTDFPVDPADLSREQNLGHVVIYTLAPLKTVGSVTSVTVSLFSIMENNQFKVPRLSSAITAMGRAEASILTSALSTIAEVGSNILHPMMENIGNHTRDVLTRRLRTAPGEIIKHVAAKAMPSNFIGDAIDVASGALEGALGFLGLDNPTIPTEQGRTIAKANGSMNYAVGPEFIEKLSVMPSGMSLVTPESFATVVDEMDVNYLYRKYSYVGSFKITNDNKTGSLAYNMPLSPFPTLRRVASTASSIVLAGSIIQKTVNFPLLSYLGLPYRYWTGGLKYKFIVSASSMHTCRLFVAFNYGQTATTWPIDPATLLDASSQYGVAIEISQGSNQFEFAVPYVASKPYLEVCRGVESVGVNSMGTLNVIVMNPLVAPTTVAPEIDICVFIAGSDDFSYEWLAGMNPAFPVWAQGRPTRTIYPENEAGKSLMYTGDYGYRQLFGEHDIGSAESEMVQSQSIAPTNTAPTVTDQAIGDNEDGSDLQVAPPQVESCVDDHFGITNISIRNLLKKYQMVRRYAFVRPDVSSPPGYMYCKIPLGELLRVPMMLRDPAIADIPLPDTISSGLLSWASGMYRQFKGGLRLKIALTSEAAHLPILRSNAFLIPGPDVFSDYNAVVGSDTISTYPQYTSVTSYSERMIFSSATPRLSILNGLVSNVLEFEIPYTSPYLSTLTYSGVRDEEYQSLGSVIVTVDAALAEKLFAVVYVALADESRFATPYRVPLVLAPAVYTVSADKKARVVSNVGYGTYAVSALDQELYDLGFAESRVLPLNPQGGTGRDKPQGLNIVQALRKHIGSNANLKYQDIVAFLAPYRVSSRSVGGLIARSGAVIANDGTMHLPFRSRFGSRRNRRPMRQNQGRQQTRQFNQPVSNESADWRSDLAQFNQRQSMFGSSNLGLGRGPESDSTSFGDFDSGSSIGGLLGQLGGLSLKGLSLDSASIGGNSQTTR